MGDSRGVTKWLGLGRREGNDNIQLNGSFWKTFLRDHSEGKAHAWEIYEEAHQVRFFTKMQ